MSSLERTLHLHLGLPKTASTWLQQEVFPQFQHLEVRCIPRTSLFSSAEDEERERRTFACLLRRSNAVWDHLGEQVFHELLGSKQEWLSRDLDLLVSDEAIGRVASRPESLVGHLRACRTIAASWGFNRLSALMFVRRQDAWLASHFAQISDRRPLEGQRAFAAMVERTLDPARDRFGFGMLLDYSALRGALASAGVEVLVLPHELLVEDPICVLERVCRWLGAPAGVAARLAEAAQRRSNSRSAAGSWTLRAPSVRMPVRGGRVSLPRLLWPRRSIALTPELSRDVLAAYEASNRRLADECGLDLGRYGYFVSSLSEQEEATTSAELQEAR